MEALEPEYPIEVDRFSAHIQEALTAFRGRIRSILQERGEVLFTELASGLDRREEARIFLLILFLAAEAAIDLEETEDDIRVTQPVER